MSDLDRRIRESLERLSGTDDPHSRPSLAALAVRRRRRRARRVVVRTLPALALIVITVGALFFANPGADDTTVATGTETTEQHSSPPDANDEHASSWPPPTVAPSPPGLPLVGPHAWRRLLPFYYSESDNERMYRQYMRRIADCAAEGGVPFTTAEYVPNSIGTISPLDRDAAEVLGYHEPHMDVPDVDRSPEAFEYLTDCANEATEKTLGATVEFSTAVDAALGQFGAAVNGWADTEEGRATLAEWSACMADQGYDYPTPEDAKLDFSDNPTVTKEEVAIRLIHLDCDIEVGLTQTRYAYEESAARRWIDEHQSLIADLVEKKSDYDATLDRLESERLESEECSSANTDPC